MMFQNDYRINHLIDERQRTVRHAAREARRHRAPSWIRVRTGLLLIHLGERIRGCAQTPVDAPAHRIPTAPGTLR